MSCTQIVPELFQLAPNTLTIGMNARVDVKLDPKFVASIKELGVIEPLIAHRDEAGSVIVRAGQRRTLAAREAGLATVPVMITEAPTDEAARIIEQVEENDRRQDMTSLDRVNVAEQLALLGYTPSQIAKRTRTERADVDAALAVSKSTTSRARMAEADLTLEAAAALAEWEGDPQAVERIEYAIQYDRSISHVVARLRNDREEAQILADAIAKVQTTTGVEAVEVVYADSVLVRLTQLRTQDGQLISKNDHVNCPGNVAMVKVVNASDREAGIMPYRVSLGCRAPESHGHVDIYRTSYSSSIEKPQPTPEERAEVIEGNKAWRAAEDVRREWLALLSKGSKLPKGAELVMAKQLAQGMVGDATGWSLLTGQGKIGRYGQEYRDAVAYIEKLTPARAAVAALAMCLAVLEKFTADVQTWRSPNVQCADYLRTLAGWGYELSEAEEAFCQMTEKDQSEHEAEGE